MKHPAPNPGGISAGHWKAAAEGRLALPYCAACARFRWPMRAACSGCGGGLEWRDASGRGTVATWSVVRRAVNPELKDAAPYVVGFVTLDEGVRVFSNIVDVEPGAMRAGLRVRARFEAALDPAISVPVFALDRGDARLRLGPGRPTNGEEPSTVAERSGPSVTFLPPIRR